MNEWMNRWIHGWIKKGTFCFGKSCCNIKKNIYRQMTAPRPCILLYYPPSLPFLPTSNWLTTTTKSFGRYAGQENFFSRAKGQQRLSTTSSRATSTTSYKYHQLLHARSYYVLIHKASSIILSIIINHLINHHQSFYQSSLTNININIMIFLRWFPLLWWFDSSGASAI